jgi:hypothetical protein
MSKKTNKRQKSANAIFVETCFKHVFSQISLSPSSLDLVTLEIELDELSGESSQLDGDPNVRCAPLMLDGAFRSKVKIPRKAATFPWLCGTLSPSLSSLVAS